VRLVSGETIVDLLFASSGIEHEIVDAAEQLEVLPTVSLPVGATRPRADHRARLSSPPGPHCSVAAPDRPGPTPPATPLASESKRIRAVEAATRLHDAPACRGSLRYR
jgi:hypothetical protein